MGRRRRLLHLDLLRTVRPEGIRQRRVLGDHVIDRRLAVGRRRADQHVLAHLPAEHLLVSLELLGVEGEELTDHVEALVAELAVGVVVFHVAGDLSHAVGQRLVAAAAVEHRDLVAFTPRGVNAGIGDLTRSTDIQNFHAALPEDCTVAF